MIKCYFTDTNLLNFNSLVRGFFGKPDTGFKFDFGSAFLGRVLTTNIETTGTP
ncbi:MAG: hypothetical protein M3Q95_03410 [Bacteroidota bacterium]|nr:hypothetical protein [Bacteroidota bacterium]